MKSYFTLLIAVSASFLYSQIKFEKGYFIDNQNNVVECLIKNEDWKNNPNSFEYKTSEDSEKKKGDIKDVKEFGVYNAFKYLKKAVDVDMSTDVDVKMTTNPDPVYKNRIVFLKVLVEGDASLYELADGRLRKYFYSFDNFEFKPLIYKKYIVQGDKIATNNEYKVELWKTLKCNSISQKDAQKLKYRTNNLVEFFINYNKCSGGQINVIENIENKGNFNLTLRPGVNQSSHSLHNESNSAIEGTRDLEFENKTSFRFGIELEYILPVNRNKWSIIFEPTYQSYKSKADLKLPEIYEYLGREALIDYKSIEIPIGVRHYMYLNDDLKIFLNMSLVLDIMFGDKIIDFDTANDFEHPFLNDIEMKSALNGAFGIGAKYNRYSVELRYYTPRNLALNATQWESKYQNLSLIAGISIF